ncbi:hypothetical protein ACFQXA_07605 [Nocardiopsis composta]
MGEIVYFAQQSVDGFIEGPEGEFDWPAVGPELSEYSAPRASRPARSCTGGWSGR